MPAMLLDLMTIVLQTAGGNPIAEMVTSILAIPFLLGQWLLVLAIDRSLP